MALWIVATRLLCPWDSPGKNTGVGCYALLQGIFLTLGWNPHFLSLLDWQEGYFTTSTTRETPKARYILLLLLLLSHFSWYILLIVILRLIRGARARARTHTHTHTHLNFMYTTYLKKK